VKIVYKDSRLSKKQLLTVDSEVQIEKLNRTSAALDDLIKGMTFVPRTEQALFRPIAQEWRAVLRRARESIARSQPTAHLAALRPTAYGQIVLALSTGR